MHVDFKITTWERVEVPEGKEEEILQAIKDGKITSAEELCQYDPENIDGSEHLVNCDEQMSLEKNEGFSTIEVISNDSDSVHPIASVGNEVIWQNGKSI